MQLEKINIKEFKKTIYSEYKKIFPKAERRSYAEFKKAYNNGITDIIKLTLENQCIGFLIANHLQNNPYLQLDYFAILPQYQNKGYGTIALNLLKEMYKKYDGIFIEIEKIEATNNEKEKQIRKRRAKFYERLGFQKMRVDLNLYGVIYSTYILPCQKNAFLEEEVIQEIFKIYISLLGENNVNKKCKAII